MAYTEMASFLNKLTGKLLEEVNLFHEVGEDRIWSLLFMLKKLTPFVMELQRRQRVDTSERPLMGFIRLLNEADDAIDKYITSTTPRRRENISGSSKDKEVDQKAGETFTDQIERIKLKIKNWHTCSLPSTVEDTVDKVVGLKNEVKESTTSTASTPHVKDKDDKVDGHKDEIEEKTTSTASSPQVDKDDKVVGLKDEVKKMIELLNDKDPRLGVIPIVGPGGVGKTTLAHRVYNHPSTRNNFPCRAWFSASNIYPLPMKNLLTKIFNRVCSKSHGKGEAAAAVVGDNDHHGETKMGDNDHHGEKKILRDLAIQTYELLKTSGRYLLVFDDVRRTQFWTDIKIIFPDNQIGGGGRIIFTTRYSEVALNARPRRPPLYLQPSLNKEESWELFCKKVASSSRENIASTSSGGASVESQSQSQPESNHPWEEWVNACGGLPLAIVKLAEEHQLRKSSAPVDKEEDKERFPEGIWELIYNSLPDELKPCLLYLGVINSCRYTQFMELIIAEGLVQPPRMTTVQRQKTAGEVEDYDIIAKEYVTELIKRNLFEVVSNQWDGSIKEIAISKRLQLMNFCISKAKEENFLDFLVPDANKNPVQEANRGAVQWQHENYFELKNPGTYSPMKSRSLLILKSTMLASERIFSGRCWDFVLNNYSSLRVLDLFGVDLNHNVPSYIGSWLVHLRYLRLNLKEFGNIILPPSIFNLWNLQFLRVKRSNSRWLSSEIQVENFWRMRQLKHILCSDVLRLPQSPPPSPQDDLVGDNLQMLKYVSPECCTKDLFLRIPNLVKLGIGGSILQGHINEMYNNLQLLTRLQKLGLQGSAMNDPLSLHKWEGASLQNITHLTFKRTRLVGDTMKILGGKLPNLQVLKLSSNAVVGDDLYVSTDDSGFRKLRCLKFEKLDMRKWYLSVKAMPSLEIVIIRHCRALQGLPSEALYKIETLRELEVYHYGDPSVEIDAEEVRQQRAGKDPPLQLRLERGF